MRDIKAPVEAAGVIRMVNRKFGPHWAIQGGPGKETDAAWDAILFQQDGIIGLPENIAKKMPNEAVESWWNPGYYGYGPSVYHQLHCLVSALQHRL